MQAPADHGAIQLGHAHHDREHELAFGRVIERLRDELDVNLAAREVLHGQQSI
jgi:hypothetical protein